MEAGSRGGSHSADMWRHGGGGLYRDGLTVGLFISNSLVSYVGGWLVHIPFSAEIRGDYTFSRLTPKPLFPRFHVHHSIASFQPFVCGS